VLRLSQTRRQRFADGNSVTVDGVGLTYDASGNMTNDGNNTLVYDAENRLLSATNGGASGTYSYDGKSLRVTKASGSTTTVYIFSGTKVIAEYDNGAAPSSPSREYVYSGGALLARIDSSGTKYYHQDQLSSRLVTDSSGNTSAQLGHFPFGESWYNASNDKLLFTSYERDSESGNDYAMMRSYVNALARFSSPDPLSSSRANPQSLNRYPYVHNDPINSVDPIGLRGHPYYFCTPSANSQFSTSCNPGGDLFGGNCAVDGIATSCGIVQSLLGAGAAVQCPDNVCSGAGLDANGNWVFAIFRASTNGKGAYFPVEGPGWEFSSEAEALAAGALWAAAATRDNGIENCGMTYSTGNGQYSFTGSVEGHLASCQPLNASSFVPSGATPDGGYHSHPDDPNYYHERFSGQPGDYSGLGGDVGWALSNNLPFGYPISLGTPEGRVIIYYPTGNCQVFVTGSPAGTGTTIPICQ